MPHISKSLIVRGLRIAGFALIAPVAAFWIPPFFDMVAQLGQTAVVMAFICYALGLLCWIISFFMSFLDDAPADPAELRRRMIVGIARVLAEWILAIVALPVAFIGFLAVADMIDPAPVIPG
ncbi:hypothetical protein BW13_04595 [Bifidobacterium sp. UTCIF-37]|uniref:hypothetical protein n=1 Tax=unclassified Bifidobacterium TaxID=2608897 RepID=UPI00112EBDA1|nr:MULTISPECIES: hypothetical protein [unclassified Bifidobacterium]TPF86785.1 hypothetical protein BW13_04595 [Bifidobacterium sp. UTCIF-37]TPF89928.1 hypothetical protein BW11_04595 [Bifidobacterium sp. UTCIF-38]